MGPGYRVPRTSPEPGVRTRGGRGLARLGSGRPMACSAHLTRYRQLPLTRPGRTPFGGLGIETDDRILRWVGPQTSLPEACLPGDLGGILLVEGLPRQDRTTGISTHHALEKGVVFGSMAS